MELQTESSCFLKGCQRGFCTATQSSPRPCTTRTRQVHFQVRLKQKFWVRIQKPLVTYDIVSYNTKTACPNLFAAFPNVFYHLNLAIFIKHGWCHFWSGNVTFERKPIKILNSFQNSLAISCSQWTYQDYYWFLNTDPVALVMLASERHICEDYVCKYIHIRHIGWSHWAKPQPQGRNQSLYNIDQNVAQPIFVKIET
jgi:hypothetical protein